MADNPYRTSQYYVKFHEKKHKCNTTYNLSNQLRERFIDSLYLF